MKFRKKRVVVEAVRWNGILSDEIATMLSEFNNCWRYSSVSMEVYIPTLEGTMTVSPGDWIIRGVRGELYPCKPDIFEATYEEVRP